MKNYWQSKLSSLFTNLIKFFPPEFAHNLTINILKLSFKKNFIVDNTILNQHILGLDFANPIGLAAGFDKNAEVIHQMLNFGFGFIEVGTITPKPQIGNNKPRIFRLKEDEAIINHLGFNNKGTDKVLSRLKKINLTNLHPGLIGINIGKNKDSKNFIEDYCFCLEQLGHLGHYITINISSPNTPGLRDMQLRGNIEVLVKGLQKKQQQLPSLKTKPILFKISPDLNDEQMRDVALVALANNISGLIIGNSTTERSKNLISKNKNEIGGLSGKPIFVKSTICLRKMYSMTNGQIPLIGVGGVSSGKECYEKIKAGANLIQLYSALVFHGPIVVKKIKKELIDLIKTDGFNNIKDVVGKEV